MDLARVLSELRRELADLDAAIASLEQLPQARPGRGHGPKGQTEASREACESTPAAAEANGRNRDSA
jgi:hypothetical protein